MKFFKLLFLCILGCIFYTSCKSDISETNQLTLIPGDATVVFEINGNEIFAKSGLNTPDNYTFLGFLKMIDAEASTFFESFLKGSREAGINAEKVLFYLSELPEYVLTAPVVDKTAFENWLKKAELPEPSDGDGFRYISISDDISLAWNEHLATVSGASTVEKIAEQFKPKTDGLLAVNNDFQDFAKKNADIRLWFKYSSIFNLYENMLKELKSGDDSLDDKFGNELLSEFKDFAKLSAHAYLNFEDGKIIGNASLYPPEEVEKVKKKFPLMKNSFNTEIIKDVPEQSYLAFNMFINVKEYVKIFRENIEKMLSNDYVHRFEIKEKSTELFEFFDSPEFKSVVDALDGDMLLSLHGFNGMFTYPLISTSFTVKGEDAFKSILSQVPQSLYTKQDNYYTTVTSKTFIPVYFAYKDNRVFVSNDLNATKVFVGEQKGKTFADNPVSKLMNDRMIFYINLDFETYPDNIKMLLQNFMGRQYKSFLSFIEIYECIYFSGDINNNMGFCLQLKNKNVNSLKQILKNIDKASTSAWMD